MTENSSMDCVKSYNTLFRKTLRRLPLITFLISGGVNIWQNNSQWVWLFFIALITLIISKIAYSCPNCGGNLFSSDSELEKKQKPMPLFDNLCLFGKDFFCTNCGALLKKSKKYKVHDELEIAQIGDIVEICEGRPVSKLKHMHLMRVLKKQSSNAQ